eukprot:2122281-Pleurochrysis_carterae.AAC.1
MRRLESGLVHALASPNKSGDGRQGTFKLAFLLGGGGSSSGCVGGSVGGCVGGLSSCLCLRWC